MEYRTIGNAQVSAIAFGTASLVIDESVSPDQAATTIDAAVDAGVTFIDTAAAYASSTDLRAAERLVGQAIVRHPGLFVATKGGHTREVGGWQVDARPASIVADCELSLATLGVDVLDLYYLHKPDPTVPFLESIGALADLRDRGLIARVGISNVSGEQLAAARELVPIDAVQNKFGPLDVSDADVLGACESAGIAYLPYSPLGGLDGFATIESRFPETARLSAERGLSLHAVLLAWVIRQGSTVIPIVGARRPASIADSARAADLHLNEALLVAIEADRQG